MSNTSSADDLFRFVRLRAVAERPKVPGDVDLHASNLSGELQKLARSARADRAAEWLDSGNPLSVLTGELFQTVLAAVRDVLARAAPITVDTLLGLLEAAGLFARARRDAINALSWHLSDLLLALLYAPRRTTPPIADIENVFQALQLLIAALDAGITPRPGGGRAGDHELLDLELHELFARPIGIPHALAVELARLSAGIADLLVVKQHIKCYEPGEIAHIENIAAGETRDRTHRRLDRLEETFETELEREVESENELETTERFEVSKEVSRTIKEDQQLSFGVNVSAAYGSVQFGSEFDFSRSDSRESSAKEATTYAKDIVERSLERVRERVRRSQTTRILREVEEQNSHGFKNEDSDHRNAIYQFVDKVFEAQVFNYGKREMLDLTIPEPASYLWYRRDLPDPDEPLLEVPTKPTALPVNAISQLETATDGTANYERWAAQYRAAGITAPPERRVTISATREYPSADETAEGNSVALLDVKVPEEYRPVTARVAAIAWSPDDASWDGKAYYHQLLTIGVTVLDRISMYNFERDHAMPGFAEHQLVKYLRPNLVHEDITGRTDQIVLFGADDETEVQLDSGSLPAEGGLKLGIFAYNTLKYVVSAKIDCELTDEALQSWRLTTFGSLQSAYNERLLEYQEARSRYEQAQRLKAAEDNAEREFGETPSRKEEIIRGELKKHCIAVITEDFFTANDDPPVMEFPLDKPPRFDLARAYDRGSFVRFFEQALEWEHIQYVLYPYFWAGESNWNRRFDDDDSSHTFRQFMQAGWSRVVVPVRPGFERAFHYYLLTGNVWMGGGLPRIGDDVYLSIADEIRSQSDDSVTSAVPYGTPWQARVPTSLVYLRGTDTLPRWERVEPAAEDDPADHWKWATAPGGACSDPREPRDD